MPLLDASAAVLLRRASLSSQDSVLCPGSPQKPSCLGSSAPRLGFNVADRRWPWLSSISRLETRPPCLFSAFSTKRATGRLMSASALVLYLLWSASQLRAAQVRICFACATDCGQSSCQSAAFVAILVNTDSVQCKSERAKCPKQSSPPYTCGVPSVNPRDWLQGSCVPHIETTSRCRSRTTAAPRATA
jgi:hypothetical protein